MLNKSSVSQEMQSISVVWSRRTESEEVNLNVNVKVKVLIVSI